MSGLLSEKYARLKVGSMGVLEALGSERLEEAVKDVTRRYGGLIDERDLRMALRPIHEPRTKYALGSKLEEILRMFVPDSEYSEYRELRLQVRELGRKAPKSMINRRDYLEGELRRKGREFLDTLAFATRIGGEMEEMVQGGWTTVAGYMFWMLPYATNGDPGKARVYCTGVSQAYRASADRAVDFATIKGPELYRSAL